MSTQGARLKEIRLFLKLSQKDFGEKIGVSKQYVSNLEADRNFLNNEKLVLLANNFNVDLNYLLVGKGNNLFNAPEYEDVKSDILNEVREMLKKRGL